MAATNNFFLFAVAILFVLTLVRAIIKFHPMESGIKAEVPHCRDWGKKIPKCAAALCGDQIRLDR